MHENSRALNTIRMTCVDSMFVPKVVHALWKKTCKIPKKHSKNSLVQVEKCNLRCFHLHSDCCRLVDSGYARFLHRFFHSFHFHCCFGHYHSRCLGWGFVDQTDTEVAFLHLHIHFVVCLLPIISS